MDLFKSPNKGLPSVSDKYADDFRDTQVQKIAEESKSASTIEQKFDYAGAIAEGYTPKDIVNYLKGEGVSIPKDKPADEVLTYLMQTKDAYDTVQAKGEIGTADSDLELGIASSLTGIAKTGNDILHFLDFRDDKEYAERFNEIDKWSKLYKQAVNDKDAISINSLGRVIPSLVSLPVSVQSKSVLFLTEAVLGYTEARADNDELTSAGVGALQGAGSVVLAQIFKAIGTPAKKNVYEYYREHLGYTKEEADKVYKDWLGLMEPSGIEYADRTRALVDHAGEAGAVIKAEIASLSPSAKVAVGAGKVNRVRALKELAGNNINVRGLAEDINHASNVIKDNYGKVKFDIMNTRYDDGIRLDLELPKELEEIKTDRGTIKELLQKTDENGNFIEPRAIDLIDAMPHINNILSTVKGSNLAKWDKVASKIDDKLHAILSDEDYLNWLKVNHDYKEMTIVRSSKLGEALSRGIGTSKKSQVSRSRALELIRADKDSGEFTFKAIKSMLGAKSDKFEGLIIADAMNKHIDDISFDILAESLKSKGFVTEQGKQFTDIVDNIAKSFKTDEAYKQLSLKIQEGTGGIGKNLLEKFQVSLAGRVFRFIMKRFPTEGAKHLRMVDALKNILTSPTQLKKVHRAIDTLGEGVKERLIQSVIDEDLPKFGDYIQPNIPTKEVNIEPSLSDAIDSIMSWGKTHNVSSENVKLINNYLSEPNKMRKLSKMSRGLVTSKDKTQVNREIRQLVEFLKTHSSTPLGADIVEDLVLDIVNSLRR